MATMPDFLQHHLAGCLSCQARLFLWSEMLNADASRTINCARCEDELGAYLEAEQSSPATALKRYPELSLHLWTCASCFELYSLMTATLSDPELQLPIGRSQSTHPAARQPYAPQVVGVVQLKRTTLNAAIPRPVRAGAVYRAGYTHDLVHPFAIVGPSPTTDGQAQYTIEAQLNESTANLIIHLEPALPGLIVLTGSTPPLICARILAGKAVLSLALDDLFAGTGDTLALFVICSPDSTD